MDGGFNKKCEEFRQLSRTMIPRFDEKTLAAPAKLHLTVCMLRLSNEREVAKAVKLLTTSFPCSSLKRDTVHLRNLCVMKGTLDKARVLYCDIDDAATLDDLSTRIRSTLRESNGVEFEDVPTKVRQYLHLYCISGIAHSSTQNTPEHLLMVLTSQS